MNSAKLSGYRTGIKLDDSALVAEKNNYASKIANAYIVYDLDTWPKNPLNNFTLKKCFLGATNIVKSNVKEKFVYNGYAIALNEVSMLEMLYEGPTFGINGSFDSAEKKFSISFSKANTKFCLSLHYNGDNSYSFVNGKEIYKFKANNKNVKFPIQFCLGSISNK